MASVGTVEVSITGMEPLKSFLDGCGRAWNEFADLTEAERAALPPKCAAGISALGAALQALKDEGLIREVA